MNNKYIIAICFLLLFFVNSSFGQLAKMKNLSFKDVQERAVYLVNNKDKTVKDSIHWEIQHLLKSDDEDKMMYARTLYFYLRDQESAEKVQLDAVKRFPKGKQSGLIELNRIIDSYTDKISFKRDLVKWNKKYKTLLNSLEYKNQVNLLIANKWLNAGEIVELDQILEELKNVNQKFDLLCRKAQYYFNEENYTASIDVINYITNNLNDLIEGNVNNKIRTYVLLAKSKAALYKWEETISIINHYDLPLTELKFTALYNSEKYFDAFQVLDNLYRNNRLTPMIESKGVDLFEKLGSTGEAWKKYKGNVEKKKADDNELYWKSSVVNMPSYDFELLDSKGEKVNSKDLKGKIIILDFWATWCGPCKASFPGMQASVNKYANDSNIVFLFINTWERDKNYKQKVNDFLAENNYSFHNLFDDNAENSLVDKYEIKGIPTKIFIDPNGKVRFMSSGSSSDVNEVLKEISFKIDFIKKEFKI